MASQNKNTDSPQLRTPTDAEMRAVFTMCRQNRWNSVLDCILSNPLIPTTSMVMDNHISTTIIHQAITSKGDTKARARVIRQVLAIAPQAASVKNGYGSLPLHVISQRNTKLDAPTKEVLIAELVLAYKEALVEQGGVGKRTPLHIIFTDYISPRITEMMVKYGRDACFMKDKKGYLPAHVACSRHCSPEKLHMLLKVNKAALTAKTNDGDTLLGLAIKSATRSHPNYALIDDLKRRLEEVGVNREESVLMENEQVRRISKLEGTEPYARCLRPHRRQVSNVTRDISTNLETPGMADEGWIPTVSIVTPLKHSNGSGDRKRKMMVGYRHSIDDDEVENLEDPANLLLNFSRQYKDKRIKLIASV